MSPVNKRSYTSTVRRDQAARTRVLIVDAATDLFTSNGYARTTVRAIAERAGVAPDTVYAAFGSKVRILTAIIDTRLAPPGVANVMDRAEARAVRDEVDQRRQLHLFARDIAAVSTRVRPMYEVLRTASAVEPDAGGVLAEMERHRLTNMRRLATWVAARGPLRVTEDRAGEIIWALASPDVARMLCDSRGWSEADHADWLEATLAAVLLSDTKDTATTRRPARQPRAKGAPSSR